MESAAQSDSRSRYSPANAQPAGILMRYCIIARLLMSVCMTLFAFAGHAQSATRMRTLVVFFDGLRPDYITEEAMPNLYAFAAQGCQATRHHSVFPTVTRVNASSYSTGSYPHTHGLMGNTIFIPEADSLHPMNTGRYSDLHRVDEATHGHLLTSITLGEVLQKHGERMMVFSSGSAGQGLMQNHTIAGGALVNPDLVLPAGFKEQLIRELGPLPAADGPSATAHRWVTDALLRYGLAEDGPLVSSVWYADPDGAAHEHGIGSPPARESLHLVDEQFGRIIGELAARNLISQFNILVSTDHGFVTHTGRTALEDFLIGRKLKAARGSDDVIVAEGAIYVRGHDEKKIRQIVSALQEEDWAGAIFTRGKRGSLNGRIAGTLSFGSIHWDHPARSGDILVDYNWNDDRNAEGYPGTGFARGVAGHGGLSPYETQIVLMAGGPSFKKQYRSELPTSNTDLAPTILALHKLDVPRTMEGRILSELFAMQQAPTGKAEVKETSVAAAIPDGTYRLALTRTKFANRWYVDQAKVTRTRKRQ